MSKVMMDRDALNEILYVGNQFSNIAYSLSKKTSIITDLDRRHFTELIRHWDVSSRMCLKELETQKVPSSRKVKAK